MRTLAIILTFLIWADAEAQIYRQVGGARSTLHSSFALALNPTGDPIGGGPGYTGTWRTDQGLAGNAIYVEADADHVVTTETELRAVAKSYYNRSTEVTENGSTPASTGQIVFLKGDANRVLLVNNTLEIDFDAGVTVASDLGYDNGDGTYRWGTTVRVTSSWLDFQNKALVKMTSGWRLTGLILEGPSVWGRNTNVSNTNSWSGEGYGVRVEHADYNALPEIDNVWALGFPYIAFNLYRGPAELHHFRAFYNDRQGFGYGVYPGRDVTHQDDIEVLQRILGGHIHDFRHATDGSVAGFGGDFESKDETEVRWQSLILSGAARQSNLNQHQHALTLGTLDATYASEARTSLAVTGWDFSLSNDTRILIDVPGTDIEVYLTAAVSPGATSIPIDDGAGGAVTVTATSGDAVTTSWGYGPHKATYSRIYVHERVRNAGGGNSQLTRVGYPPPDPASHLTMDHFWSSDADVAANMWIGIIEPGGNYSVAEIEAGAELPPMIGDLNLNHSTIYDKLSQVVRPISTSSLASDEITAGGSVTLTLSATHADGHDIRFYEVSWGDGVDVLANTERFFPGDAPSHTYMNPGVYSIRVSVIDEYGVPGFQTIYAYVSPVDTTTPTLTFRTAPELPSNDSDDWSGYYTCRLQVKGTTAHSYDWGAPANRGWQDQSIDVIAALSGQTDFDVTLELETDQTIASPRTSEPGDAACNYDNFYLWNDGGLLAAGAAWSNMDPLFDATRSVNGAEWDWGFQSVARIHEYDTPSSQGGNAIVVSSNTTLGAIATKTSKTQPYLHAPLNLGVVESGSDLVATWDVQALSDRVNVRFYQQSDDALLHQALLETDDGSYTFEGGASENPTYVRVEPVAEKWDHAGTDVTGQYAQASE